MEHSKLVQQGRTSVCGRCGYPLNWDGVSEYARCSECGATHSDRWMRRAKGRTSPAGWAPWLVFGVPGSLPVLDAVVSGILRMYGYWDYFPAVAVSFLAAIVLFIWMYAIYLHRRSPGREWYRNMAAGFFAAAGLWVAGMVASVFVGMAMALMR